MFTSFPTVYLSLMNDFFRHQHHDHERCKERRRRRRRKILVHNLDDKSLKVRQEICFMSLALHSFWFHSRIGNRSWFWWASTTCKVYYHRHCMSSTDNVFAACRDHFTNGPDHRWYGWVPLTLRDYNLNTRLLKRPYEHNDGSEQNNLKLNVWTMKSWEDSLFHICICLFYRRIIIFMALGYLFHSIIPFVLSHLIIHFPSLTRPSVRKNTSFWCEKWWEIEKSEKHFMKQSSDDTATTFLFIPEGKTQNNIAKVWISDE